MENIEIPFSLCCSSTCVMVLSPPKEMKYVSETLC